MNVDFSFKSQVELSLTQKGQDCSEIDYFLCQTRLEFSAVKKTILNSVNSNTSDHKSIQVSIPYSFQLAILKEMVDKDSNIKLKKVNWKKS